jgi:argininosuccinate synthase
MAKVVLAYSGGLDTSVCVKWLQEEKGLDVITFSAELGQGLNQDELKDKALKSGAKKVYIEDLREIFLEDFVLPALMAGASYEGKYLLATALGRPLIAKKVVEIAEKEGAQFAAHGCTGKGNDQVRFELAFSALNPSLEVIAPLREWSLKTRSDEVEYAKKHNIPVPTTKESPYSIDRNIWGVSIECGELEDPWEEVPEKAYKLTVNPQDASDKPLYLEICFDSGIPKKINGKEYGMVELVELLNKLGGENGVGRVDLVENRVVGIKSREVYEAPAATILHISHRELENLVLDRETAHFKESVSRKFGEVVYYGMWYSPLREALDTFIKKTQEKVTGTVRMKLYRGTCETVGRKSPNSLYDLSLATYEEGDKFDRTMAKGFIKLWGLPFRGYRK